MQISLLTFLNITITPDDIMLILQFVNVVLFLIAIIYSYHTVRISKKQLQASRHPEIFILAPNEIVSGNDYQRFRCQQFNDLSSAWRSFSRGSTENPSHTYLHFINGGNASALDIVVRVFCDIEPWIKKLNEYQIHLPYLKLKYDNRTSTIFIGSPNSQIEVFESIVEFNNPKCTFPIAFITQRGETEKSVIEISDLYRKLINLNQMLEYELKKDSKQFQFELPPIFYKISYSNIDGERSTNFTKLSIKHNKGAEFLCETKPLTLDEFHLETDAFVNVNTKN